MKRIRRFNENTDQQQPTKSDYDPTRGRGHSYKENLSRGNNEFVYKVLPELEKLVSNEMSAILKKVGDNIRSGKLPDSEHDFSRDYALALGSLFYDLASKR